MRRAAEKLLVRPVIDEPSNEAIRRGREIEDLVEHGIVRLNLQLQFAVETLHVLVGSYYMYRADL